MSFVHGSVLGAEMASFEIHSVRRRIESENETIDRAAQTLAKSKEAGLGGAVALGKLKQIRSELEDLERRLFHLEGNFEEYALFIASL